MDKRVRYTGLLAMILIIIVAFALFQQPKKLERPVGNNTNQSGIVYPIKILEEYFNLSIDKSQYSLGESVVLTFDTNSKKAYVCGWGTDSGWTIKKFDGKNWEKIDVLSTNFPYCKCVNMTSDNSTIEKLDCARVSPPHFRKIKEENFVWDQKMHFAVNASCGGSEHTEDAEEQAPPGRYSAKFCYFYNVTEGEECLDYNRKDLKCVDEKEFEIVS